MKKVLAFDLDGTIVDSMGYLADFAAGLIYESYGLSFKMSRRLFLITSGIPFNEQIQEIFPDKEKNKEIVDNFERLKEDNMLKYELYPEVRQVFKELSDKGFKLAISSSNAQHIIENYFEHFDLEIDLICGYKKGFGKGKKHFNYIKKYFNVDSDEIMFVGDSFKDFERASNNNVDFTAKAGTFSVEDFKNRGVERIIENLNQLQEVL